MLKFIRKRFKIIVLTASTFLLAMGIFLYSIPITRYLIIQGFYQAKIVLSRRSIPDLLKDPKTDPKIREKLQQVDEIKKFGVSLGLSNTNSYNAVYDTEGRPIVWAVSACPKDKLEAKTWKFPIVGKVPYLGYFRKEDAQKMQEKLQREGYDTVMRSVSAYSTLGILPNPLFSSMLLGNEEYLANTILHEMTHETIFIKDDMVFNESLANFVGNAGAMEYLKYKYGDDSPQVISSRNFKKDDEIFSNFMADLYDELDKFYKSDKTYEEKVSGREEIFAKYKEKFKNEIKSRLLTHSFDYFEKVKLNNAYILFNRTYHKDYNVFDDLYNLQGKDLHKTIEFLKSIKGDKDVKKRIEEEVRNLKSGVRT